MTETKYNNNIQQSDDTTKSSSKPIFSGIDNLKLNDLEQAQPTKSVIFETNQKDKSQAPKQEVDLANLGMNIQPTQPTIGTIKLDNPSATNRARSRYHNQYWRLFLLSFFVIVVSGIASLVLQIYTRYLYFASQPIANQNYQTYVDTYKKGRQFIDALFHLDTYKTYDTMSLLGSGASSHLDTLIQDKDLNYIQKKDTIQQAFNTFSTRFIANKQQLTTIKENISQYGFFSQEIYDLLEDQSYATSIKQYLLSLEIIKFSSAIKVFSYLDTFVSSVASALNITPTAVETNMHSFAERGEKDILIYLNNCYLNPYEIDYTCDLVGDFDRYYTLIDNTSTKIDTKFFKKMMYYVDVKLEQVDIPSFSIVFKKYDPTQKEISFTVDVNTFKQDEIALIKKGIINPHIFILSNLLNLIKQSSFVVSENINAKSIKILPKVIQIGSSIYNVNNSRMDFLLPIQKSSAREISDYIDPTFTSSKQ